ncbi:hypothetical protein BKA69DRAFT_1105868 [Paraphysoderma sedebokerense]|nr:hypothetical protein BKA69DRAFT_1105868 [Paraphysoderma sedebokerense]
MNKPEVVSEDYTEVDDASHKRRILSTSMASRKRQRLDVGNVEAHLSFSNFEVLSTISDVCKLWIYRDAVSSQLSTQSITPALSSSSSVGRDCIIQIPASRIPSSIIPTVSFSKYFSDITIHMSTVATSNPSSPSIEFSTSFSLRHFKMFSALKSSFHTRSTLALSDPNGQNKPGELILAKVPHRSTLKLSFVYHDIENVVSRFLNDLNRVRIMTVLLKQLKGCISGRKLSENSESDCPPRLERFKKLFGSGSKGVMNGVDDQENHDCVSALTIELVSFNFLELRLKYAKEFGFTVKCDVAQKSEHSTIPFHTSKQSGNIYLSIEFFSQNVTSTNPHTFVHRYMELALNSHYSIPSFLRLLHATTYPLLLLHNYVDSTNTQLPSSSANRVRIIPRSSTHFRLFFPPCFGVDIKVVPDQSVICLSDVTCSPFDAGGVIPKVPPPATLQETPSTSFIDSISYNPIPRFTSFFSKLDAILFSSSSLNSLTPAQVPQTAQAKAPNQTTVATSEPQVQEIQPQDDFFDMLNLDSLESAGPVSPKFSALLDSLTENSSLDNSMELDHTLTSSNPNSGMTLSTSKATATVKNQLESGNDSNRFKSFQIPHADDLLLVLPRCIIFGTNLFGTVLEELRKSLVTPILFEKLHVGVKSVPGVLQRDDMKLVFTARGLEFTVFVDAQGQWKFSVASKDIQSFSQDEANRLTNQLNQTVWKTEAQ